jgi:hypothetical protein
MCSWILFKCGANAKCSVETLLFVTSLLNAVPTFSSFKQVSIS